MPKRFRAPSPRVTWPIFAAVAAVVCCLLGAWPPRPTRAERCNNECGHPTSLSPGVPDVSRDLCNRLCLGSISK